MSISRESRAGGAECQRLRGEPEQCRARQTRGRVERVDPDQRARRTGSAAGHRRRGERGVARTAVARERLRPREQPQSISRRSAREVDRDAPE
jgi:hypothetical protein